MVTGIICSILLLKKSDKKPSNKFLSLGILGFVWLNTKTLLHAFNLWDVHGFGFFPNGIELALPPLFYFYAKSLLDARFQMTKKVWIHFIPFFLSQIYAIVVYIAVMQTQLIEEKDIIANGLYFNEIKSAEDYLTLVSSLIYLFFAYQYNQNYKHWLATNTSDTQLSELRFVKVLLFSFIIISCCTITNIILNQFLDPSSHDWRWKINHIIIAFLVYYMGLVGYKNSDIIPKEFAFKTNKSDAKIEHSIADKDLVAKLIKAIENDKVYLNPKLSLQELATMLDANDTVLSNTIKTHYNKNFRSFINELRVKEVQDRLINDGLGSLSLLGLANECGFNSEASFYRIFRATTGLTPKQFLESHSSNTGN